MVRDARSLNGRVVQLLRRLGGGRLVRFSLKLILPFIFALGCVLTLFIVFQGSISRYLNPREKPLVAWSEGGISVRIGGTRTSKAAPESGYRVLELSLPFSKAPMGCEFVYGAAVVRYHHPSDRLIQVPRYLFKFQYDLEQGLCVSRDLSIVDREVPMNISIQLIDVTFGDAEIIELPREEGVKLEVTGHESADVQISRELIPQEAPFRGQLQTSMSPTFSTNFEQGEVEELIAPYDDVKATILREISRVTSTCRERGKCSSIRGAIAEILDPDVMRAFEEASAAGVEVDIITNFRTQSETSTLITLDHGELKSTTARFNAPSPWMWLRRNPHDLVLRLPMHTKFLVLGEDLVISTNANFNFMFTASSREITMVYRRRDIAKMYSDIHSQIRTSVYRPLSVDLRHNFILLFNADRPRRYSVGRQKPYVSIETNEGVRSSAYGILLEMIARQAGQISLSMAPISDTCAVYERRNCFFDLLSTKARDGKLSMFLNSFFYFDGAIAEAEDWRYPQPSYHGFFQPKFESIRKIFPEKEAEGLVALMQKGNSYSLHHERLAVFGDEWSVVGSANFGQKGTINVIELIRDPALVRRFSAELATFDEPYFVSPLHAWTPKHKRYGNCEFTLERDLLRNTAFQRKRFSRAEVLSELRSRYSVDGERDYFLVEPAQDLSPTDGVKYLGDVNVKKRVLGQEFESFSSYLCIEDEAGETYVVRALPLHE